MTLHWWMHWFWITRPLAVATQLIFLLAAVQTVPLPPSTLDPHVQSSHNSRTIPATSWDSGNDATVAHNRPTSEYIDQRRQTAVYGGGPVWSSSPDIEEPFYPTTASSHMSNRDVLTENIPITQKTISTPELISETYQSSSVGKTQSVYGNPTELSLHNFDQYTAKVEEFLVKSSSNLEKIEKENVMQILSINNASEEHSETGSFLKQNISVLEEPQALPLELSPIVVGHKNEFVTNPSSDLDNTSSKKKNNRGNQKEISSFNRNSHHMKNINDSTSYSTGASNIDGNPPTDSRKLSQRLVIRDLSNISEPMVSLGVSSQGSNSTNLGNPSLQHPSIRASKEIGSFPHSSASSSDVKKDHVTNTDRMEQDNKSVKNPANLNKNMTFFKEGEVNSDIKITRDNVEKTENHSNTNHISFSTFQNNMRSHSFENISQKANNRRILEVQNSKLAPASTNETASGIISSLNTSHQNNEDSQASTINNLFQNVTPNPTTITTLGVGYKESSSPETSVPFDSSISQRITTLSDTEEAANLTPVHSHGFIGRSSSLNHDAETTMEPSVAPVSRSRVAVLPSNTPHRGLDAASITGIALGIVVFAGLTGAVSFILYRRRYLNKPQTLNDKCSNPDSSGYIDDSTLRENSEEMYSLDNDSFLNSLEAMTIQNYWTDNQETCWRQSRP